MRETTDVVEATIRLIGAIGKRVAEEDPDGLIYLQMIESAVEDARAVAVAGLRASGATDVAIGRELGISRQAVQQRWPRPAGTAVGAGARYQQNWEPGYPH